MSVTEDQIRAALAEIALPDGGTVITRDMLRALRVDGDCVSFILEGQTPAQIAALEDLRDKAQAEVMRLAGVREARIGLTAHRPPAQSASAPSAPSLKIGGHPKPQSEPMAPKGVARILAIGSGKGGVGKSTVSSNLAVALARAGRRVGLLDADIYGPSQPRMMGVTKKPASPDGQKIIPLIAHGVTMMSIGLMLPEDKALVWRGPMLMGALQQMMMQVEWGELDVLLVDLPPGTGDVAMTLCQRAPVTGAVIVSTPQDVALLDARRAVDMFNLLKTPVLGLVENMSGYLCPKCGHEAHIFGQGGVAQEAQARGLPFLGALPISLETRLAGDAGAPIALGDGPAAQAYANLAARFIGGGMA